MLKTTRNKRTVTSAVLATAAAAAVVAGTAPGVSAATPAVFTSEVITQTPVQLAGLPAGVQQIATDLGGNYGLALDGGTVYAWGLGTGDNSVGQLGDGTTVNHTTPAPVLDLSGITQISAGGDHGIAIGAGGVMWSWGDNHYGQIGDGTTVPTTRLAPVRIPGPTAMTQVAVGADFNLGLRSDGTVWAWGDNSSGQLGDGTTTQRDKPKMIPGLTHIIQVAAGTGDSYALRSDGTLFAWGNNILGALGDGTTTNRLSPGQVPGLTGVTAVSAGEFGALAIVGPSHTVYGWGDNAAGEIGDGTKTDRLSPVPTSLSGVSTIAAGLYESAAIRPDGTLLEWGAQILTPKVVSSLTGVTQVSLGDDVDLAIGQAVPPPPPTTSTVPNLHGDTTTRAGSVLQAAGLSLGSVGTVVDNTCNNIGTVLSQTPAAGTTQPRGSAVSITIGVKPTKPCP